MADGDIGVVEGRLPVVAFSSAKEERARQRHSWENPRVTGREGGFMKDLICQNQH